MRSNVTVAVDIYFTALVSFSVAAVCLVHRDSVTIEATFLQEAMSHAKTALHYLHQPFVVKETHHTSYIYTFTLFIDDVKRLKVHLTVHWEAQGRVSGCLLGAPRTQETQLMVWKGRIMLLMCESNGKQAQ